MLPIQQLLSRFKNLTNTDKVKKGLIVDIFKTHNIPISLNQITFIKNDMFIKTQPLIKAEISLHKQTLLNEVRSIKGLESIHDIR